MDFLHKPIAYERFERAVVKAVPHMGSLTESRQEAIVVKQDCSGVTVPVSDIYYIEAMENYSRIFRIDGENIISRLNIKALHEMLPKNDFLRVHRSFLIPISKVCRFSKQEIHLQGLGRTIPIGRSYAKDIYEILAQKRRK